VDAAKTAGTRIGSSLRMSNDQSWKGKRVLLTGHTGFKGSWLSLWLSRLGVEVHGLALDPPTTPNLFTVANINSIMTSDTRLDIRNAADVNQLVQQIKPEVVFHLAAQPLVQFSYEQPVATYATNVMGTAHVLDALRFCDSVRAVVVVTTDKVYENHETMDAYLETDRLNGLDPYSSSKACAELVATAYRASYFKSPSALALATARAGNVIGGGDWADNRLIPDCIRAYAADEAITLRYPAAIRPWQHVLESVYGYILLAENLMKAGHDFAQAWNFGPEPEDMQPVKKVVDILSKHIPIAVNLPAMLHERHEAGILRLDSTKAKDYLNWQPRWSLEKAIEQTIAWYRQWLDGSDMLEVSKSQIAGYLHSEKLKSNSEICI
jgi:CDP-glucose 4,6-dehydratase